MSGLFRTDTDRLAIAASSAAARALTPGSHILTAGTYYTRGLKVMSKQLMSVYVINAVAAGGVITLSAQGCPEPAAEGDENASVPYADLVNGTDFLASQGVTTGLWKALGTLSLTPYIRLKVVVAVNTCTVQLWMPKQ